MLTSRSTVLCALMLFSVTRPGAADDSRPPTQSPEVRPVDEHAVYLPAFEYNSSSEFGTRIGGSDDRRFAFSGDGKKLVGQDAGMWHLEVFDVATGRSEGRFGKLPGDGVIDTHPLKPQVVVVDLSAHNGNRPVTAWDFETRKMVRDLDEGVNTNAFAAAAMAPDSRTMWLWEFLSSAPNRAPRPPAKTASPAIRVWDVATGDEIRTLPSPAAIPDSLDQPRVVQLLAFAPHGWWVAAVAGRRVLILDAATGQVRTELGLLPGMLAHSDRYGRGPSAAEALAVSGDGKQVLVGCNDGAVRRWDVASGRELPPLTGHKERVRAVWCSSTGTEARSFSEDKVLDWLLPSGDDRVPKGNASTDDELAAQAEHLGDADPAIRYEAVKALAAHPAKAVEVLRAKLQPIKAADPMRLSTLVSDLNGTDYNARKRAARELRRIGEPALAALINPNDRFRRPDSIAPRIAQEIREKARTPELLQAARAIEVLERIGTPEARKVLDSLTAGAEGASLTRLAEAASERVAGRAKPVTTPADLPALWTDLGSDDAARAHRAVLALASRPAEATGMLRSQLAASPARNGLDAARIPKLIEALADKDFETREAATQALAKYGQKAEPAMRAAMAESPNPEVRRRLTTLLKSPADLSLLPEALRARRAIESLELIATPDAKAALEEVSRGAKANWFREVAARAAKRIGNQ